MSLTYYKEYSLCPFDVRLLVPLDAPRIKGNLSVSRKFMGIIPPTEGSCYTLLYVIFVSFGLYPAGASETQKVQCPRLVRRDGPYLRRTPSVDVIYINVKLP